MYQEKFFNALNSGELLEEDIPLLIQEIIGAESYAIELAEVVDFQEQWLMDSFSQYEIRAIHEDGESNGHLVMIAELDNVELFTTVPPEEFPAVDIVDFPATVQEIEKSFAVLPRTQKRQTEYIGSQFDYVQLTPELYSAYEINGQVVEYFERDDSRRNRGGAVVLQDGQLIVVNSDQVGNYTVGENCQAIEVCAFTVNSETAEEDLTQIDSIETMAFNPSNPLYASFVLTLRKNDKLKTVLVSVYNHIDHQTGARQGTHWESSQLFSPRHAAEIAFQLAQIHNFPEFTIAIPDSGQFSMVVSSDTYQDEVVQDFAARNNYRLKETMYEYVAGFPQQRVLYEEPFSQAKIPHIFLAATKSS